MSSKFVPTYLYIKEHVNTGLKYFGKTTLPYEKMLEYNGSGTRWLNHLNMHGATVKTIWFKLFTNEEECVNFALDFSAKQNIVESVEWANLIPENGLSGCPAGIAFNETHKKKLSETKLGKSWEDIYGIEGAKIKRAQNSAPKGPMPNSRKENISAAKKGMQAPHGWDPDARSKVSKKLSGIPKSKKTVQRMREAAKIVKTCPHCSTSGSGPSMQRWHFNNCKLKNDKN